MVRRIIWAPKALEDLREIHAFIARDSTRYAQSQIKRIQATAERPKAHPKIGRRLPEFPREHWRELLSGNYRIIYRHEKAGETIWILAVVHARRLLDRSMVG